MEHIKIILESQGLKSSDSVSGGLLEKFNCPICEDAGTIHPRLSSGQPDYGRAVPCQCRVEQVEKDRQQRFLRFCKLPARAQDWTFENFHHYNNADLKEALEMSRRLADGDSTVLWLTLLGDSDRGKTHLAVAICQRWLELGKVARFAYVPDMLDELQDSLSMEGEDSYRMKLRLFCDVSLLVLDDLGTGKYTDWRREQVVKIVNHRAEAGLPLVVTSQNEIDNFFGSGVDLDNTRIASRLQREPWCHVVIIGSMEHRLRGVSK